jgi:hypothetical protein
LSTAKNTLANKLSKKAYLILTCGGTRINYSRRDSVELKLA